MGHTRFDKYKRSPTVTNKGLKIRNSLLHLRKKLVLTLPTHLARKNMHEILTDSIKTIDNVENALIKYNYEGFIVEIINRINTILNGVDRNYNYIVAGPSSWNEYYKYYQTLFPLSAYELSALKRINYDLFYFVNRINKDALINTQRQLYEELKRLIEKFKEFKELRSKLKNPSNFTPADVTRMDARKIVLESENNIFISIEKEIKDLIPHSGGVVFYITDIDKNITPKSKHVFKPIKKFELSLVIYKKNVDMIEDKLVSIIPKPAGLFGKQKTTAKKIAKKPAKPVKVAKPAKPVKVKPPAPPQPPRPPPTRIQPSRSARKGGSIVRVGQDYNMLFKKTIFSFNVCYDETFDSRRINHLIVDLRNPLHYLNEAGLYILYEQQIKNLYIYSGEYNTSSIREKIYKKISIDSKPSAEKQTKLSRIAWGYYTVFLNSIYYNEKVFISLLDKFLKNTQIGRIVNDLEVEIIERFRPYINACIVNINNQLQAIPEFNNDIGIFVAGGDSIRRYKNDITQTKDIDSKIHVPYKYQTEDNLKKILLILLENLFNLCAYFIVFKEHIFTEQIKRFQYAHDGITYNLEFILYNTDPAKDLSNFKFRQIYKDTFPVDLFSLDYKCEAILNVSDRSGLNRNLPFDFEISFLDVVVEMLYDDTSYYKTNSVLSNNGLAVSSLEFLIQDLTKTYNSMKSSSLRFLSGKIEKDHVRYDELIRIKNLPPNAKPYTYTNVAGSIIPVIADNNTLPNFATLKSDREQLDGIIVVPTQADKTNIDLIKKYEEFVIFLKSYYDTAEIKKSKVLTTYDIDSMKKLMDEQAQPKSRAKRGGLMDLRNKDLISQMEQLHISDNKKKSSFKSPSTPSLNENTLITNKLLKCLVLNNNLINSYALYMDINEYDDLFITPEIEILKNAEYVITDNDIVQNKDINQKDIQKYKQDFYKNIHDFFKDNGVTSVPPFNPNKDFYEITWTNQININVLQKYIDSYGGCSLYYEQ
jgi:hypothetical protein